MPKIDLNVQEVSRLKRHRFTGMGLRRCLSTPASAAPQGVELRVLNGGDLRQFVLVVIIVFQLGQCLFR